MLVTTKDLLERAEAKNQAVGYFNITGLETLQAVISAAEKLKEPIGVQFAQVHEEVGMIDLDVIGPIMVEMAEKASVPIAVHLDHGVDLSILKKALDMGFTSIMYDGSDLPFAENVANTKIAVHMAAEYGASVEAEIGMMSGLTLDESKTVNDRGMDRSMFTDPQLAKKFVDLTGVDCLACAFGTVHGMYHSAPNLDFELVKELKETIGVPIVMHGGSGVSAEDYQKVIEAGVRKVNYYTYMAIAGGEAAKAAIPGLGDNVQFHDLATAARAAMEEHASEAIRIMQHND